MSGKNVRFLKKTHLITPTKLLSLPVQQVQFSHFIFLHTLQSIIVEKLSNQTSL